VADDTRAQRDLEELRRERPVLRRDRLGGLIREYSQVA